ncbi:MAG: alkaline phosphatase family protein, partial [Armatimonadota bacterium]
MARPKKLVLIGLDAPIPHRVLRLVEAGELPTFGRLLAEGVYAENCLVPHPTITPPNWTSIVTGAWAGTHGITCFNVHNPGDPLDEIHQGFTTDDCKAEYIWDAAERGGKNVILMNYPSSWPPTHNGIQVAGAGLSINEWRVGAGFGHHVSIAEDQLFATEEYPLASVIELEPASDWAGIGGLESALEAPIPLQFRDTLHEVVDEKNWWLLVTKGRQGYETVLLAQGPPTRTLKLQAIRIGGLGITAIPNEVFGATGLRIKKKSPLQPTMNVSLANGYFGYIPPPEQFELGGYTTWR